MDELDPKRNFDGTWIGFLFTVGSAISIFTVLIPAFSVIPGAIIENILSETFLIDQEVSVVADTTIVILTVILIGVVALCLVRIWKTRYDDRKDMKRRIIICMVVIYLVVHPLGFYIWWATFLNYRADGQLVFGATTSFRGSSLAFLPFGLMIDLVKNIGVKNNDN